MLFSGIFNMGRLQAIPLLLASITSFAQVQYEPGYFIDESDKRVQCLIRNEGWFRNPDKFSYKLTDEGEKQEASLASTKEFGVANLRYFRHTLEVDTSSQNLQRLSINSGPEWDTRTVFLQRMVEGPAKLYRYRTRDLQLFFYSVDSSRIEQLVYKRYSISVTALMENLLFRSQARGAVACDDNARNNASRLKYQVDDLSKYFEEYNKCKGFVRPEKETLWKSKFHITIAPGFDAAYANQVSDAGKYDTTPQSDPGYRLGVMLEFGLPFHRNKWALIVEPTFQRSLKSGGKEFHSSVELPLGIRHSFFLGSDMALFLDFMMVADFFPTYRCTNIYEPIFASVGHGGYSVDRVAGCAAGGAGLRWKSFSFETRYYFNRRVTSENQWHLVDYTKTSFIVGYKIH
jgi:hypothetical protein